MSKKEIVAVLEQAGIAYACLEQSEKDIQLLISESQRDFLKKTVLKSGWKKVKDKSGDLYLYGMKRFMYYSVGDIRVTVCCQLACRSSLNEGWVPLDAKINSQALLDTKEREGFSVLKPEDELCYLLAKCVYTVKEFKKDDIERIKKCFDLSDKEQLLPKLQSVFFRFTERLLQLMGENKYEKIISALWSFAEY